jgi:hypothetical protein
MTAISSTNADRLFHAAKIKDCTAQMGEAEATALRAMAKGNAPVSSISLEEFVDACRVRYAEMREKRNFHIAKYEEYSALMGHRA